MFKEPKTTPNDYGDKQVTTYSDYKEILAGVTVTGGNKNTIDMELFLSDIIQLSIRYRTDIDETYHLIYKNQEYQIMNPFKYVGWHDTIVITANLLELS